MTSAVPGTIAWPVLILLAAVTLGRWRLLNHSPVDRLINRALIVALVGLLLREAWFEDLLARLLPFGDADTVQFARQLSFGCIVLTVTYIYNIVQLWGGADPARTWQRQRVYDIIAAAVTIIILIAGTPARRADQLIDQALGWPAVIAWAAFYLPIGITALVVGRISIKEMRVPDTTGRERALYLGILGIALAIGFDAVATPIITAIEVVGEHPSRDPEMATKSWTFFLATVCAGTVVAVPLASTLLTMTGWDRTGRYCRRLQPLWRDVTAAVPEIVLDLPRDQHGRVEPATRLHRMTVEIRDSLLQLKRYGDQSAVADNDPNDQARRIAAAIAAKNAGHPPTAITTAPRVTQPGARDLTAELQQLLALAKAWPRAHRAARPAGQAQTG
ncbi:MAB_1171c family putative transporter [Nocardia brasiliensis]|uniref:MAB_1171c family putative transporter n=1 Tax=Nocardia brasiliensis TaxID=37326 RepID=UPI002457688D|nr:MAB_1171c family putative transporter [Nocardia brasiliensis]